MSRSFTIINVSTSTNKKGDENLGGRFVSSTPASAAKKAGSKICRQSAIKGRCVLYIEIKETTLGSNGKVYKYKFTRVYDPTTIEYKNGLTITKKYKTKVESI
jgi:hypothetical protein